MATQLKRLRQGTDDKPLPAIRPLKTTADHTMIEVAVKPPPNPEEDTQPFREEPSFIEKRRTSPRVAQLRSRLRPKLLSTPDEFDHVDATSLQYQQIVRSRLRSLLQRTDLQLSEEDYQELETGLIYDLLGFGAIEPLIQDRSYSEIMVNVPEVIFAERKGKLYETEIVFDDEEHLQWTAQRIVRPCNET